MSIGKKIALSVAAAAAIVGTVKVDYKNLKGKKYVKNKNRKINPRGKR